MKFGQLDINPAQNPGILDTGTWDVTRVRDVWRSIKAQDLAELARYAQKGQLPESCAGLRIYPGSLGKTQTGAVYLAGFDDGQCAFIECVGPGASPVLNEPVAETLIDTGGRIICHAASMATIHEYTRRVCPHKGPRALGGVPRLGIGVRMTTSCWPGIFQVMTRRGLAANPIQNSIRELNTMATLLEARPAERNYACGFGTIECGYTGSSFEGLWVSGVLAAIKHPGDLVYGADADHIQVKRGPEGLARAKRYLDCSRYYSFYTLDMADVLDYTALKSESVGRERLERVVSSDQTRRDLIGYYAERRRIGGREWSFDESSLGRLMGKYGAALEVVEQLTAYLRQLKGDEPFDLELSIDEHPPEVAAFDCLTTDEEVAFLGLEIRRRGLAVTHLAPNFGVEKGLDYRCPDGLAGLEARIRSQFALCDELGLLLDFHSGDDLTGEPRRVIQKATNGRHQFKISPMLQILFARVLERHHPALFEPWWSDALDYARREAAGGAAFAQSCLADYESDPKTGPRSTTKVFHHYSFAFVGRRDAAGRFLHRERFYNLPAAFYQAYQDELVSYLNRLADELF